MRRVMGLLALMLPIFYSVNVWAWNDDVTHQDLSEKAAEHSILSSTKGDYLKNLGFDKNLDETFTLNGKSRNVRQWIRFGSLKEDAGTPLTAVYYHHFHNPLLPWDQAGLDYIAPSPYADVIPIVGESSLLWAQNSSNEWSWQRVRVYYYLALTSQVNTDREANFARTFRGLGHIIHLIQDSAQPAHVRNDPHPLDGLGWKEGFESWAKKNTEALGLYNLPPVFPTVSLNTSVGDYTPISQFWDANQYNGTNPPGGTNIGISEYTNANFFSEDTINSSNFLYPRITQNTPVVERDFTNTFWNTTYPRQYYLKNCCGETNGDQGYLLSAVDYLDYYRKIIGSTLSNIPVLDRNVYQDYASLLLPRAVGYSAGLINYFFRGQLDGETEGDGNINIVNKSSENMEGAFELYYDDTQNNRHLVTSWSLSIPAGGKSYSLTFTPPTSPEPKEKGKYILVFRGRHGEEEGSVIGKVVFLEESFNAMKLWMVRYYQDQFELTDVGSSDVVECYITRVSWQFSGVQGGSREVYLFMKFIKDPSLDPNFYPPIKPSQLAQGKAIGRIPPYREQPFMTDYPDTYGPSTGSMGIIQVSGQTSPCFDKSYPCAPRVRDVVPAALVDPSDFKDGYIPPSNHYVFYTDEGFRDSGALVPDSKDTEVMLTFLTFPEIETLAKALHPKLLPPDFLKPANGERPLYAYVKFTVPNIESWNLSFSDKGICPLETIASTTVANMWDLSEIVIKTGDGEIVGGTLFHRYPRVKWHQPNNVYGPEYQRLERHEWTSSGTLYYNSWRLFYNPDNPFAPIREDLP